MAQVPLGSDAFSPAFTVPPASPPGDAVSGLSTPRIEAVETFDPVARAQVLARELPLFWSGTYQAFGSPERVPVQMRLATPRAIGLVVDLRGEMRVGEVVSPVQGNLNARSDQLDLLLLRPVGLASLEPGGVFIGLQGLSLTGWQAARLTNPGGRLELSPLRAPAAGPAEAPAAPVRGLW
ncbi:MAG: hypothetical protein EA413_06560 [Cyanobium sp. PLM2.Bin73]|nr:MAG: hypothetical protein EA413_06560 [Cyanobium sp. PLM2.Bin73]